MKTTKTEHRYQIENREYVIRVYRGYDYLGNLHRRLHKVTTSWHKVNFFDSYPPASEEFKHAVTTIVNDWIDKVCK